MESFQITYLNTAALDDNVIDEGICNDVFECLGDDVDIRMIKLMIFI